MLLQAIGAGLPAAVAVTLSPFPVIGIVLVLAGPRGRASGLTFATGWIAGLSVVTTVVALAFGGVDEPESTSAVIADWGRIAVVAPDRHGSPPVEIAAAAG